MTYPVAVGLAAWGTAALVHDFGPVSPYKQLVPKLVIGAFVVAALIIPWLVTRYRHDGRIPSLAMAGLAPILLMLILGLRAVAEAGGYTLRQWHHPLTFLGWFHFWLIYWPLMTAATLALMTLAQRADRSRWWGFGGAIAVFFLVHEFFPVLIW